MNLAATDKDKIVAPLTEAELSEIDQLLEGLKPYPAWHEMRNLVGRLYESYRLVETHRDQLRAQVIVLLSERPLHEVTPDDIAWAQTVLADT